MNFAILSTKAKLYSTRRLVEAAEARGHEVQVLNTLKCYMDIATHNPGVHYQGAELPRFDAVIPRIGASLTFYGTAVLRQFEMIGTYPLNESVAIVRSRDKLRSMQILARAGLGLPVTSFAHSTDSTEDLIALVGGAPLVVKLLQGMSGQGLILCETAKAAGSVIEAFRNLDANFLVQEFIKESSGVAIRVLVLGGRVVGAVQREARAGEFRSDRGPGIKETLIRLTPEERSSATRAASRMGLNVAGVDLLRSNHGPVVMEVNSSPSLEGIELATERDVAGSVIEFLEKNARPNKTRTRGQG